MYVTRAMTHTILEKLQNSSLFVKEEDAYNSDGSTEFEMITRPEDSVKPVTYLASCVKEAATTFDRDIVSLRLESLPS